MKYNIGLKWVNKPCKDCKSLPKVSTNDDKLKTYAQYSKFLLKNVVFIV